MGGRLRLAGRAARGRRVIVVAGAALVIAVAGLCVAALLSGGGPPAGPGRTPPAARGGSAPVRYGTLDTGPPTAAAEARAGVSAAMFEFNWASFEPGNGQFSASYLAMMRSYLHAYRAAGMKVTLGLGLENPPPWVFALPDSTFVDQSGQVSGEADFVFSRAVRDAAAVFLRKIAASFPLEDFWAIRLTSGGDPEMLYPGGGFWAFSHSALTGDGLPAGMTPNPFPRWRPGRPGLTRAQIGQWVNWYVGGLDNVTAWQMQTLTGLGFTGYYQTVTPGSGTRPDRLADDEQANLPPDPTTEVGAVWDRYYAMLPTKTNVVAYISSVADGSGGQDSCQPGDTSLPLTSRAMDTWSATRWISRIARQYGLLTGGENPGFGIPALDREYVNRSSSGMMADAIRQARSCGFQVFYWAHDVHLWDGTVPFSVYASMIAWRAGGGSG